MAKSPIYVFKTTIGSGKKKSVREFALVATAAKSLAELAYAILAAYDFEGGHLFEFQHETKLPAGILSISGNRTRGQVVKDYVYFLPSPDESFADDPRLSEGESVFKAKIKQVFKVVGDRLTFVYDFGDYWEIDVSLSRILTDESLDRRSYPQLLSGKGINLEDDMGGYEGLLEALEEGGENGFDSATFAFDLKQSQIVFHSNINWLRAAYERGGDDDYEWNDDGFDPFSEGELEKMTDELLAILVKNADVEVKKKILDLLEKEKKLW